MIDLRHFLIDWLTIRIDLDRLQSATLRERVHNAMGKICCYSADGVLDWEKNVLDVDKLRSDTQGLVWMLQGDGKRYYLVIGGSPASLANKGLNVFGNLDIRAGANTLIRTAQRALRCILPPLEFWQCRRIDITGNYLLPDAESVKLALQQLMISDGGRRKASNAKGSDTVCWNLSSDLTKGKAYHKGPQVKRLQRLGKLQIEDSEVALLDRLLRLEHTRGARWFRRFEEAGRKWWQLTAMELYQLYRDFFERLTHGLEVTDMNRHQIIKRIREANDITQGRAEAAFTTLRNIRNDGFDIVKGFMNRNTFQVHLRHLRTAGITDADLHTAKIIPLRRVNIVLAQPVGSWEELRRVA